VALRANIRGLIADLDDTLIRYSRKMNKLMGDAAAQAALDMGFRGTHQDVRALAIKVWRTEKTDIGKALERDHGIDNVEFTRLRHRHVLKTFRKAVKGDPKIRHAFNRLSDRLRTGVLTHGSQEYGEEMVFGILRLNARCVFGIDHPQINHRKKDEGPEPFIVVAKELGTAHEETAVVEDTGRNLYYPNQLGMQGVLVTGDKPLIVLPGHIDSQVSSFSAVRLHDESPARRRIFTGMQLQRSF
jgi:FMN phosphatase YigB (HAD superfamily)